MSNDVFSGSIALDFREKDGEYEIEVEYWDSEGNQGSCSERGESLNDCMTKVYPALVQSMLDNVEDERNEMGSQSRIYDYNTGIYARILPSSDGKYGLAEAGRASAGIFYDLYGFEGLFDDDFDLSSIETDIDNLGSISTDEVNFIIQHGFLEFLMQKGTPLTSEDGFKTILKAERILKSIEDSGKLTYDDVLQELQKRLEAKDITEEDKRIIEGIQDVYKNTMFSQIRQGHEFNTLLEERKQKGQHTAQEISDDLHEIARTRI